MKNGEDIPVDSTKADNKKKEGVNADKLLKNLKHIKETEYCTIPTTHTHKKVIKKLIDRDHTATLSQMTYN